MTTKGLRVAQVVTTAMSLRYLLLNQIRAMQDAGYEVTAVSAQGPHVVAVRAMGCPVDVLPIERESSPLRDLKALYAMFRYFRRQSFDVVITHTPKAGLLGPLAAQLAGVPLVIHTVHGLLFHDRMPRWKQGVFFLAEWFTAAWSDYLFFQSREDVERARALGLKAEARVRWIGNGIDLARFDPRRREQLRAAKRVELGLSQDDWVVGTVGRLVYEKGYQELFEAAEHLFARGEKLKLVIIGPTEPDQKDSVSASQIAKLQSSQRVLFLGAREDVAELYPVMDVLVLASHREGIPRVLMEASAMEVPVIATNIRGCREVVQDGETGILTPLKNSRALAEAIETMRLEPARARAMGKAGRKRIEEQFDEGQVCQRLLGFLSELSSRAKRGSGATYSDL